MRTIMRALRHSTPNIGSQLFLPIHAESDSFWGRGFNMNNRGFAILIVVCLGFAGGGCAFFRTQNHKHVQKHTKAQSHSQVVLLPRQTGSNLDRRITVDDESSFKSMPEPESTPLSKKHVKTKRTGPETPKHAETEKPKETSTQPDRFR